MNGTRATTRISRRLTRCKLQKHQYVRDGNQGTNGSIIDTGHDLFSWSSNHHRSPEMTVTEKRNPYFDSVWQSPNSNPSALRTTPTTCKQQEARRVDSRRLTPERPRARPCIQASLTTYARVNGALLEFLCLGDTRNACDPE